MTLRVIVVDDNVDDIQIVLTTLEYHGIEVHAVTSARECDALLQQLIPDLVLTDLSMPEGDGWTVLNLVRDNTPTSQIPVVAMTSYHSPKLADEVIKGGFDDYFPKPIDPVAFVGQLQKIIGA